MFITDFCYSTTLLLHFIVKLKLVDPSAFPYKINLQRSRVRAKISRISLAIFRITKHLSHLSNQFRSSVHFIALLKLALLELLALLALYTFARN